MGKVNKFYAKTILNFDNWNHPGSPASPRLPSSQLCSVQGELCINLQQNPKHALQLSHLCKPRFGRWRTATGTGCLTRRSSALPCEFLLSSLLLQQLHLQRYLIEYKLAGNDLPCILPPHLKPPSQRWKFPTFENASSHKQLLIADLAVGRLDLSLAPLVGMERVDLRRVVAVEVVEMEVGTLMIRSLSLLPGREGEAQEMGEQTNLPSIRRL